MSSARMQELLRLLSLVVEHVRSAAARADRAEGRAAALTGLLDAMAEENAGLRAALAQAEVDAQTATAEIRAARDRAEAAERLTARLEARAAEAELRIQRAAEALGAAAPTEIPIHDGAARPSAALH